MVRVVFTLVGLSLLSGSTDSSNTSNYNSVKQDGYASVDATYAATLYARTETWPHIAAQAPAPISEAAAVAFMGAGLIGVSMILRRRLKND